jgi:hypothetical protein
MISIQEITNRLNKREEYLSFVARNLSCMVKKRKKAKKSGGYRDITCPNEELKDLLRKINKLILSQFTLHKFLFLQPGCNHIKMLSQFSKSKFLIAADIDDFYPTIYPAMVTKMLTGLNFDNPAAKLITRIITFDFELPQGFPTSPKIAALTLNPVIIRLDGLAGKEAFRVGLYADNLVIGSNFNPEGFQRLFVKIFRQHGFLLDEFEVYNNKSPREIMGICVHPKLKVNQCYVDTVKHEIVDYQRSLRGNYKSIKGKIDYIAYVNPQQAADLKRMLKDLD